MREGLREDKFKYKWIQLVSTWFFCFFLYLSQVIASDRRLSIYWISVENAFSKFISIAFDHSMVWMWPSICGLLNTSTMRGVSQIKMWQLDTSKTFLFLKWTKTKTYQLKFSRDKIKLNYYEIWNEQTELVNRTKR